MPIIFGNWKLVEKDARNWELFEYRTIRETFKSKARGTAGESNWISTGRFYSFNTFSLALLYAADQELKNACKQRALELKEAISQYEQIVSKLLEQFDKNSVDESLPTQIVMSIDT